MHGKAIGPDLLCSAGPTLRCGAQAPSTIPACYVGTYQSMPLHGFNSILLCLNVAKMQWKKNCRGQLRKCDRVWPATSLLDFGGRDALSHPLPCRCYEENSAITRSIIASEIEGQLRRQLGVQSTLSRLIAQTAGKRALDPAVGSCGKWGPSTHVSGGPR